VLCEQAETRGSGEVEQLQAKRFSAVHLCMPPPPTKTNSWVMRVTPTDRASPAPVTAPPEGGFAKAVPAQAGRSKYRIIADPDTTKSLSGMMSPVGVVDREDSKKLYKDELGREPSLFLPGVGLMKRVNGGLRRVDEGRESTEIGTESKAGSLKRKVTIAPTLHHTPKRLGAARAALFQDSVVSLGRELRGTIRSAMGEKLPLRGVMMKTFADKNVEDLFSIFSLLTGRSNWLAGVSVMAQAVMSVVFAAITVSENNNSLADFDVLAHVILNILVVLISVIIVVLVTQNDHVLLRAIKSGKLRRNVTTKERVIVVLWELLLFVSLASRIFLINHLHHSMLDCPNTTSTADENTTMPRAGRSDDNTTTSILCQAGIVVKGLELQRNTLLLFVISVVAIGATVRGARGLLLAATLYVSLFVFGLSLVLLVTPDQQAQGGWLYSFFNPYMRPPEFVFLATVLVLGLLFLSHSAKNGRASFYYFLIAMSKKLDSDRESRRSIQRDLEKKSSFLASISHEIRTPLQSILSAMELVPKSETTDTVKEILTIVSRASTTILDLVNDMIDLRTLDKNLLVLQPSAFDIGASIDKESLVASASATEKGIQLFSSVVVTERCGSTVVMGDKRRVKQVFRHIFSNSVKYASKGTMHLKTLVSSPCESRLRQKFFNSTLQTSFAGAARTARAFGGAKVSFGLDLTSYSYIESAVADNQGPEVRAPPERLLPRDDNDTESEAVSKKASKNKKEKKEKKEKNKSESVHGRRRSAEVAPENGSVTAAMAEMQKEMEIEDVSSNEDECRIIDTADCSSNGKIVMLSFIDQGEGISDDRLLKVFDRYEYGDTSDASEETAVSFVHGVGHGLNLSMKLVATMGGVMIVDSVRGTGSVFTVILPFEGCDFDYVPPLHQLLSVDGGGTEASQDEDIDQYYADDTVNMGVIPLIGGLMKERWKLEGLAQKLLVDAGATFDNPFAKKGGKVAFSAPEGEGEVEAEVEESKSGNKIQGGNMGLETQVERMNYSFNLRLLRNMPLPRILPNPHSLTFDDVNLPALVHQGPIAVCFTNRPLYFESVRAACMNTGITLVRMYGADVKYFHDVQAKASLMSASQASSSVHDGDMTMSVTKGGGEAGGSVKVVRDRSTSDSQRNIGGSNGSNSESSAFDSPSTSSSPFEQPVFEMDKNLLITVDMMANLLRAARLFIIDSAEHCAQQFIPGVDTGASRHFARRAAATSGGGGGPQGRPAWNASVGKGGATSTLDGGLSEVEGLGKSKSAKATKEDMAAVRLMKFSKLTAMFKLVSVEHVPVLISFPREEEASVVRKHLSLLRGSIKVVRCPVTTIAIIGAIRPLLCQRTCISNGSIRAMGDNHTSLSMTDRDDGRDQSHSGHLPRRALGHSRSHQSGDEHASVYEESFSYANIDRNVVLIVHDPVKREGADDEQYAHAHYLGKMTPPSTPTSHGISATEGGAKVVDPDQQLKIGLHRRDLLRSFLTELLKVVKRSCVEVVNGVENLGRVLESRSVDVVFYEENVDFSVSRSDVWRICQKHSQSPHLVAVDVSSKMASSNNPEDARAIASSLVRPKKGETTLSGVEKRHKLVLPVTVNAVEACVVHRDFHGDVDGLELSSTGHARDKGRASSVSSSGEHMLKKLLEEESLHTGLGRIAESRESESANGRSANASLVHMPPPSGEEEEPRHHESVPPSLPAISDSAVATIASVRGNDAVSPLVASKSPVAEPSPSLATRESASVKDKGNNSLSKLRCMIVEDDGLTNRMMQRVLRALGISKVMSACDGVEALSQLEEYSSQLDFIVMDCQMPNMDGLECTTEIRKRDWRHSGVPIIAATAGTTVEVCNAVGMTGFLQKPVRKAQLEKEIRRVVFPASRCPSIANLMSTKGRMSPSPSGSHPLGK